MLNGFNGGRLRFGKKTTRITIETDRVLVVTHPKGTRVWCVQTEAERSVLTLDETPLPTGDVHRATRTVPLKPTGWRALIGESVRRFIRNGFVG